MSFIAFMKSRIPHFPSLLLTFTLLFSLGKAQTRIDGSFAFQTDPNKLYSIYVPASYDAQVPNTMVVGLHPWNTSRWNASSWCDTLITFAEMNNLLLVCPDGGVDGQVDDQIDTAFTTVLIDSMKHWYNVDDSKVFAMGFSWGGRTTYTYGFSHPEIFCGYLPIGAAISGTSTVTPNLIGKARNKPVYIVHGENDSPNNRYWPMVNALPDSGVVLNSILLPNVAHTIDFPNRNQILTTAFQWLDSVCANPVLNAQPFTDHSVHTSPNPAAAGSPIRLSISPVPTKQPHLRMLDMNGKEVKLQHAEWNNGVYQVQPDLQVAPGLYFLEWHTDNAKGIQKIVYF